MRDRNQVWRLALRLVLLGRLLWEGLPWVVLFWTFPCLFIFLCLCRHLCLCPSSQLVQGMLRVAPSTRQGHASQGVVNA